MESVYIHDDHTIASLTLLLGGPRAKEKMTDWKLTLANAPPATRSSAFVLHSCALRKRDPDAVSMATGC